MSQDDSIIQKRLDPPKEYKKEIKDSFKLIIQLIFILVMFVPLLVWIFIGNLLTKPKSVKGKVVLITGAGRGLGRGIALKFADLGCKIACVDIDNKLNQETLKLIREKHGTMIKAKIYSCDVSSRNEIKALKKAVLEDFGEVNILVNNAGLVSSRPIMEIDEEYTEKIINVNFISHISMIHEFIPEMIKRNEGHLVAIASSSAFMGLSNASLYASTKHAVLGLMESVDAELNEKPNNQIKVSVICPYFVNTSPLYMQFWDLRLPALSIDETVAATVDGILKNKKIFSIPNSLCFSLSLFRMLPDKISSRLNDIFYARIIPTPRKIENIIFKNSSNSNKNS